MITQCVVDEWGSQRQESGEVFFKKIVDLSQNHHETTLRATPGGSKNHPNPRLKVPDDLAKIENIENSRRSLLDVVISN